MHPLIERLDAALAANYPEFHAALGPGSSQEDLDELERIFGLPLPRLYRDFLAWRGPSPAGAPVTAGSLIYNQDLMTAREVIDTITVMRELRASDPSWVTSAWSLDRRCDSAPQRPAERERPAPKRCGPPGSG